MNTSMTCYTSLLAFDALLNQYFRLYLKEFAYGGTRPKTMIMEIYIPMTGRDVYGIISRKEWRKFQKQQRYEQNSYFF